MTQGVGAEAGFGILFDYGGDDTYAGRSHGFANSGITYHSPSDCGSNFSFLIDYGGKDEYGSKSPNNSYLQRGSSGGFLIDRPFDFEAEADKAAAEKAAAEKTVADETDQKPTQSNRRPQPNRQRQQQETKRPTVSPVPTVGGKK